MAGFLEILPISAEATEAAAGVQSAIDSLKGTSTWLVPRSPSPVPTPTPGPSGGIFDNPIVHAYLHPIDTVEAAIPVAAHVVKSGANVAGQAAGLVTQPMATAISDMAGFLSVAVDKADSISKKVFIGEMILAGVTILGVGAALFVALRSSTVRSGVTKILLGRAP
jgi:hypothetical protein